MEVIRRDGTTLVFYHDADGCALRSSVPPVGGDTVYRCDYKDYAPNNAGFKMMDSLKATKAFLYQFVFVKCGEEWKAFVSGILLSGSQTSNVTEDRLQELNKLDKALNGP